MELTDCNMIELKSLHLALQVIGWGPFFTFNIGVVAAATASVVAIVP